MTSTSARILLLSQRRLRPSICRTSQNEYEDVIASVDDVDLIAPAPRARQLPNLLLPIEHKVSRRAGLDFERRPWPQRATCDGNYELLFIVVQHPSDLNVLEAIPDWRSRCRKAVVFIEELWTVELKYEKMLRPLQQFDAVVCGHDSTVGPLQELTQVPCYWDGVGVDAIRFCPLPHSPKRVIDFLSMGRRGERTHAALLEMAASRDFYYEYDTVKAKHVLSSAEHRILLANRIKRSRYFLVNTPKVDAKHQRGNQEEIGMRFYEGAAGGAVLVGESPDSPRFREHFGWEDSCIDFPYDSADIEDFLDDLDQQPGRLARARRENVTRSLLHHDWIYRYEFILQLAGLKPQSKASARVERLRSLAAEVASEISVAHERVLI